LFSLTIPRAVLSLRSPFGALRKLRVPQIEYEAAAFSNAVRQPSKDVAILSGIEMSEALAHHDRGVERFRRRLIIAMSATM